MQRSRSALPWGDDDDAAMACPPVTETPSQGSDNAPPPPPETPAGSRPPEHEGADAAASRAQDPQAEQQRAERERLEQERLQREAYERQKVEEQRLQEEARKLQEQRADAAMAPGCGAKSDEGLVLTFMLPDGSQNTVEFGKTPGSLGVDISAVEVPLTVKHVKADGVCAQLGIQPGWQIIAVNGEPCLGKNPKQCMQMIMKHKT